MKKLLLMIGIGLATMFAAEAQNNLGKADDAARIALAPVIDDNAMPASAKNMLESKIRKICTLNGLAGEGSNPMFSIRATVDVLSKDLTATAPPMHALSLTVNMYVVDNTTGNVFSQTSVDVKGAGQNESKAYVQAIKSLDPKRGQFKAFVEQGKNKIIEFYNSQCDMVISRATALKAQGRDGDASALLYSVPEVCKECYDRCMELAGQTGAANQTTTVSDSVNAESDVVEGDGLTSEIESGVFVAFKGCKRYGDKIRLTFSIENRNAKDYEFELYMSDLRLIDSDGNNVKMEKCKMAGKDFSWHETATVMNGTPVTLECECNAVDIVKMFEIKKDNKTYRMLVNTDCQ
ncbi:MAG: hypothetical protein IKN94_07095 [Salinivirgaceae bacterium]|nr:hypothetical protein [Salinivirgaceae bacterium]